MTDHRVFGFDLGSQIVLNYPEEIDFDLLADWDLKPEFVLIRAHSGNWTDPAFEHFVRECEAHDLPWGAWHVLARRVSATEQARIWVTKPAGLMGRWIDYEPWRDGSIPTGTQLLETWDICEQKDGRATGCYSRYRVIDKYLNAISTEVLNMRPWWLAQYLYFQTIRGEHPGPPTKPARVSRANILIQQTADKLPPPPGSVPNAKQFDRNRWEGSMSLDEYLDPAIPPDATIAARVKRLEEMAHRHSGANYGGVDR